MLNQRTRAGAAGCISDLTFDMWHAGDLEPARAVELEAHLADCVRCAARDRRLRDEAEDYLAKPECAASFERALVGSERAAPLRTRRGLAALAFAAALASLLAWYPGREMPTHRTKGGMNLSFFVKRGEAVFRGSEDERVRPGDQLRFTVRPKTPGYVAVLARDARGRVTVYDPPPEAPVPRIVPTGDEIPLDAATELDDVAGTELIYGLLCESSPRIEARARELSARGALAPSRGCEVERLRIHKELTHP